MIDKNFDGPLRSGIRKLVAEVAKAHAQQTGGKVTVVCRDYLQLNWEDTDFSFMSVYRWLKTEFAPSSDLYVFEELQTKEFHRIAAALVRSPATVWTINCH
jgi:hypothetical protein